MGILQIPFFSVFLPWLQFVTSTAQNTQCTCGSLVHVVQLISSNMSQDYQTLMPIDIGWSFQRAAWWHSTLGLWIEASTSDRSVFRWVTQPSLEEIHKPLCFQRKVPGGVSKFPNHIGIFREQFLERFPQVLILFRHPSPSHSPTPQTQDIVLLVEICESAGLGILLVQNPVVFHRIGDGHQTNSRDLYSHYRDSLWKVGWPSPI